MLKKLLVVIALLCAGVSAQATDYVFKSGNNYLGVDASGNITNYTTFNPAYCIWTCYNGTNEATLGSTARSLKNGDGDVYLNYNSGSASSVKISNNAKSVWVLDGDYLYYTSYGYTYYLYYSSGWKTSRKNSDYGTNRATFIASTTHTGSGSVTNPTLSTTLTSTGITLNHTNISGTFDPAYTQIPVGNTTYYKVNGSWTTTQPQSNSNWNNASYEWSVVSGPGSISNGNKLTFTANTGTVKVKLTSTHTCGYSNEQTLTFTLAQTAAIDETAYSDIAITPASQTLDLGGTATYTIPATISKVTRTRDAYVTITGGSSTYYKVGSTYQSAEPTVTETPGTTVALSSVNWSFSGGDGNYYTPSTYYSDNSNTLTLTRNTAKTASNKTYTITASAKYDNGTATKTATASVTIPMTWTDLTALHAGEALNLGIGETGMMEGHYTYEPTPDNDAAGAAYKKFTFTSANTSVATVDANGTVTAVAPGSTTITVQSIKQDGTNGVSCNVTVNVTIEPPAITIDASGHVTITHPYSGASFRYTTNGTNPTASTGTLYNGTFTVASETTVKAVAVANGVASAVASQFHAASGVSGTRVILNDYMDHSWTLFQPQIDGETNPIYNANPRDVKITYKGNGGAVSKYESANEFVYYKTLTDGYKYTTIPNPFSKRPKNGSTYQGFSHWKITKIQGGTITGQAVNSTVNAETELTFVPASEYGMEVEFQAVWTTAYVVTCKASEVNSKLNNSTLQGNSYETNFIVINDGTSSSTALNATTSKKVTITMVTPDGATDYRSSSRFLNPSNITLSNDWKFEYINMNNNGNNTTITANNHNLVMGRGVSNTDANGTVANYIRGVSGGGSSNLNYHIRVESGKYNYLSGTMGYMGSNGEDRPDDLGSNITGTVHIGVTLGSDYDRAEDDNSKLTLAYNLAMGSGSATNWGSYGIQGGSNTTNNTNKTSETFVVRMKSGSMGTGFGNSVVNTNTAEAYLTCYMSFMNVQSYAGKRKLFIEGGSIFNVAGGIDENNNATDTTFYVRMTGGQIRGSIYGAAAFAATKGHRKFVFTGGEINGWIAGGANGTTTTNTGTSMGVLPSNTYIYIGGNCNVNNTDNKVINVAQSGDVFGAGNGGTYNKNRPNSGQVDYSHVVIADNAYIKNDVYGGGNQGHTKYDARIWITGGHVGGKVFGGSNMNSGENNYIKMVGGVVDGGMYGGSNSTGTISGNVDIKVYGGQVGRDASHKANICGGGYGDPTVVAKDVDIVIGRANATAGEPVLFADTYGGSEMGIVNGTNRNGNADTNNRHVYVTVNDGTITGNVYGGGLGNSTYAANTFGKTKVTVNGGTIHGSVFGCNNVNGRPKDVNVRVYVNGGTMDYVYGGGNNAAYTGNPHVWMSAGTVNQHVFGGGLGSGAVVAGDTWVYIYGPSLIKNNVYGGGNGGEIHGGTHVKIGEEW